MSRDASQTTRTWDQIITDLERLTSPKGEWSIEWNSHRGVYETVDHQWQDHLWDFENPEEAVKARRENRLVGLHWYKDTPVGSYKVAATDMEGLRRMVSKLIDEVGHE